MVKRHWPVKDRAKQLMVEKRKLWVAKGEFKGYDVSKLEVVSKKLAKVSMVPKGYFYPEIHHSQSMPYEFEQMLKRKAAHEQKKCEEEAKSDQADYGNL